MFQFAHQIVQILLGGTNEGDAFDEFGGLRFRREILQQFKEKHFLFLHLRLGIHDGDDRYLMIKEGTKGEMSHGMITRKRTSYRFFVHQQGLDAGPSFFDHLIDVKFHCLYDVHL